MTGLRIPDAALNAATSAAYSFSPDSDESLRLRMAAELRRLAEALDAQAVGDSIAAETLRARADELDGGAS